MGTVAFNRRIKGSGTPEAEWQAWPGLHGLPFARLDDLVRAPSRAVVVAPHPDDEIIGFGGLLAMLAQRGTPCSVVAVTDGEASHPGSHEWPPNRLARQRRLESLESLQELGLPLNCHARLSIPDGRVAASVGTLQRKLVPLLQPGDVVLSTWQLDGHPDHEAASLAIAEVCARLGCRYLEAPVWMWHWARPADMRVPWHRMRRLLLSPDTLRLKTQALAAHQTQLASQDTGAPAVLPSFALERMLRDFECFFVPEAG